MVADVELAYLAGFFDADGCITITRRKVARLTHGVRHRLVITVTQKTPGILRLYAQRWGGWTVRTEKHGRFSTYVWRAEGPKLEKFLEDILPYLQVKRAEAEVGLAFRRRRNARRHWHRGRPMPREEYLEDEASYHEIRRVRQERP